MPSSLLCRMASVAAAGALLAGSGCSVGADQGPEESARSAVETLLKLCHEAAAPEIALMLATPAEVPFVAAGSVREGCEAVVQLVPPTVATPPPLAEVFAKAEVAEVIDADGGLATVRVTTVNGWESTVEAERHGDFWVVTNSVLPEVG